MLHQHHVTNNLVIYIGLYRREWIPVGVVSRSQSCGPRTSVIDYEKYPDGTASISCLKHLDNSIINVLKSASLSWLFNHCISKSRWGPRPSSKVRMPGNFSSPRRSSHALTSALLQSRSGMPCPLLSIRPTTVFLFLFTATYVPYSNCLTSSVIVQFELPRSCLITFPIHTIWSHIFCSSKPNPTLSSHPFEKMATRAGVRDRRRFFAGLFLPLPGPPGELFLFSGSRSRKILLATTYRNSRTFDKLLAAIDSSRLKYVDLTSTGDGSERKKVPQMFPFDEMFVQGRHEVNLFLFSTEE